MVRIFNKASSRVTPQRRPELITLAIRMTSSHTRPTAFPQRRSRLLRNLCYPERKLLICIAVKVPSKQLQADSTARQNKERLRIQV